MGEDGIVVGLNVSDLVKQITRLFFAIVGREYCKFFEKEQIE